MSNDDGSDILTNSESSKLSDDEKINRKTKVRSDDSSEIYSDDDYEGIESSEPTLLDEVYIDRKREIPKPERVKGSGSYCYTLKNEKLWKSDDHLKWIEDKREENLDEIKRRLSKFQGKISHGILKKQKIISTGIYTDPADNSTKVGNIEQSIYVQDINDESSVFESRLDAPEIVKAKSVEEKLFFVSKPERSKTSDSYSKTSDRSFKSTPKPEINQSKVSSVKSSSSSIIRQPIVKPTIKSMIRPSKSVTFKTKNIGFEKDRKYLKILWTCESDHRIVSIKEFTVVLVNQNPNPSIPFISELFGLQNKIKLHHVKDQRVFTLDKEYILNSSEISGETPVITFKFLTNYSIKDIRIVLSYSSISDIESYLN